MKGIKYISAGAGSGKTYKLTHELADLIIKGKVKPEGIIMTTFTKKAASELRERAKAVLYEKGYFNEAERLDQSLIGTVHSVANALIQKYWYYLGISPDLQVMTEEDTSFYISQSLALLPTPEEVQFLSSFRNYFNICKSGPNRATVPDRDFWRADLKTLIEEATKYEIEDLQPSLAHSIQTWGKLCVPQEGASPLRKESLIECLRAVRVANRNGRASQKQQERDDTIEERLSSLAKETVSIVTYSKVRNFLGELPKTLRGQVPAVDELLAMMGNIWDSPEVFDLQCRYITCLFDLAERWREEYRRFKKEHNLVDYNDMELYLIELLKHEEAVRDIQASFSCLMVDEFQDSSPVQVRAFEMLSQVMEYNVWVGDAKQAIYGFRGTDIDLTNAVMKIIEATPENGNQMETLPRSYRSLPSIVELTNRIFVPVFSSSMPEDRIRLMPDREQLEEGHPLTLWAVQATNKDKFFATIAKEVAEMVGRGVPPQDIAILARQNDRIDRLAPMLADRGIPVNREGIDISETGAYLLITSLIQLVIDASDTLARAQIAFITKPGYTLQRLIDDKLAHQNEESEDGARWLDHLPLIAAVLQERERLQHYSAAALVESLVVEFGLYQRATDYVRSELGGSIFDVMIQAAKTYEERCVQMTLPATLSGFLDYMSQTPPMSSGDRDGVNLVTYHGAKGLEWRHVILIDLDHDPIEEKKLIRQSFFGVHARRVERCSQDNLYPEARITVLPWLFGSSLMASALEEYLARLTSSKELQQITESERYEAARLLYVGVTRARDALSLAVYKTNPLKWFQQIGLHPIETLDNLSDSVDCLAVGQPFVVHTLTPEEEDPSEMNETGEASEPISSESAATNVPLYEPLQHYRQRNVSPSMVAGQGRAELLYESGERIPRIGQASDSLVGDCIHQIFSSTDMQDSEAMAQLVSAYQLQGHLTSVEALQRSWSHFVDFLRAQYGEPTALRHELPFKQQVDGQIITGSIDMLWETAEGVVLIDFKTYSGTTQQLLDPTNPHYAGRYKGQLDCYQRAIEASGQRVLDQLIFYPILGDVVRLLPLD